MSLSNGIRLIRAFVGLYNGLHRSCIWWTVFRSQVFPCSCPFCTCTSKHTSTLLHTHTSSIIDVGDGAPQGSSSLFSPPRFCSCSVLSPAHLLLSSFAFHLFIHCLSSCPSIYMPAGSHPFNVLTVLEVTSVVPENLSCCSNMPFFFTSSVFDLLPFVSLYLYLYLNENSPSPPKNELRQNPHYVICARMDTHTHKVVWAFSSEDFCRTEPGSLSRC